MGRLRLSRSLSARILATAGARIALVVLAATAVSYWHVTRNLESQALEQLGSYVEQRAIREGAAFVLARDNLEAFARSFTARHDLHLKMAQRPGERIDELFEARPDGTLRVRPVLFHAGGLSGVVRKNVPLTAELRDLLVDAVEELGKFGPAWEHRFVNLYVTLPDGAVVMFWPDRPWGSNRDARFP